MMSCILRFFSVFGDIKSKPNCKKKCQTQKAEELEVHPNIHTESISNKNINKTDGN